MNRLAIINVVGLCAANIGAATPNIRRFRDRHSWCRIRPAFPAVTCTAQSNYLTGKAPSAHGIVANGWYHRELAEVQFWKQSNHLVQGEKIWDVLKRRWVPTNGVQGALMKCPRQSLGSWRRRRSPVAD